MSFPGFFLKILLFLTILVPVYSPKPLFPLAQGSEPHSPPNATTQEQEFRLALQNYYWSLLEGQGLVCPWVQLDNKEMAFAFAQLSVPPVVQFPHITQWTELMGAPNSHLEVAQWAFPHLTLFKVGDFPAHYWDNPKHHRLFLFNIATLEGLKPNADYETTHWKHYEALYALTTKMVEAYGGAHLLQTHYNRSLYQFLRAVLGTHVLAWKLENVPQYFWKIEENRKEFLNFVLAEEGVVLDGSFPTDDWRHYAPYTKITGAVISKHGGEALLSSYYNSSVYKMLKDLLGNDTLIFPWQFGRVQAGYWKDIKNVRLFFDYMLTHPAAQTLFHPETHHSFSSVQKIIKEVGGGGLLTTRYKSSPALFLKDLRKWSHFRSKKPIKPSKPSKRKI